MIGKIKKYISVFLAATALSVPVLVPAVVSAQNSDDIQGPLCQGAEFNFDPNSGPCTTTDESGQKMTDIIKTVVNVISVIVGVVAVIMIIFGGFKYISSGGDSGNVSSAKNTIIFAIVGLVVVALAQFIVRFVLNQAINTGEAGGGA